MSDVDTGVVDFDYGSDFGAEVVPVLVGQVGLDFASEFAPFAGWRVLLPHGEGAWFDGD